jgi:hypothetical protein
LPKVICGLFGIERRNIDITEALRIVNKGSLWNALW